MPPRPFFAGAGLDRADHYRADAERLRSLAASPSALELVWDGDLPTLDSEGRLLWREVTEPALFLGLDGEAARFSPVPSHAGDWRSAVALLGSLAEDSAPVFAAALSLARWHMRHGFCANCGAPTEISRGGWSRRCPSCSADHYPRVDPVVIMLAENDGRVLLGRQHHYPPGRYSALAGFVEVGETIEDAVARELHEEAGIRVTDVAYAASQPWPFPSSLMIGCTAQALQGDLAIDRIELDDARWFSRDEVASALAGAAGSLFQPPPRQAIARTLLEHWLSTRNGRLEEGRTAP